MGGGDRVRLAVIGRRLCEPLTGVGRYLENLLYHWSRGGTPFERIVVYTPAKPNLAAGSIRAPVEIRIVASRLSPLLWENLLLPAKMEPFDLIFGAYTLPWTLASKGVVSNLGIYESRRKDFSLPARLRTTPFFRHSARHARRVLANSESTRNDLVRFYNLDADKIEVVYLGVDEDLNPAAAEAPNELPAEIRRRFSVPAGPFFLFAGKLSKRRNIPMLLEAYARLRRQASLPQALIIIGPDYLGLDVPRRAAELSLEGSVVYLPYVPIGELAEFYRAATAFVLPSVHEGFSLTVVESMACGTPVVVFDHAALEGGVREAALVIEDPSVERLQEALRRVAEQPALRQQLREKGLLCAQRFRWRTTAEQTMAACERVLPDQRLAAAERAKER